jgi:hypothetical protein
MVCIGASMIRAGGAVNCAAGRMFWLLLAVRLVQMARPPAVNGSCAE